MCAEYLDWAEKYRPVSLSDIIGNDAAVKALLNWAKTYGSGKNAVILYGPPGVGKTSAALALAHDMGWDYIELNASDVRTKDAINRIAGAASHAGTFEGTYGRRLIILDEADNLHGNADRGGESAIINVIKKANQPIILIANDMYAMSKPLRDSALQVQFRSILSTSVAKALRRVCTNEGIRCDPEALMKIAERTNDLRSAINDLQAAAQGQKEVKLSDVSTGERDVPETVFKVMGMIFRGHDMRKALEATYDLDENPEDLIAWVDENLGREYKGDDLERGFDVLSKADIYLGRVRRRQDYGMWRFAGFMMVCGINRARRHSYGGFSKYSPPTYWQKLGRAKSVRVTRDSLAAKVGKYCHTSKAEARSAYIPLLKFIFEDKGYATRLSAELGLDEDEIAYLLDTKKTTKKVGDIYKESREIMEQKVEEEIDLFARFGKPKPIEEPRDALIRAVEEEEKPPSETSEKIIPPSPAKKRAVRTKRKSRDGGEELFDPEPDAEAEPAVNSTPATVIEGNPVPEVEEDIKPKGQKTLFDF